MAVGQLKYLSLLGVLVLFLFCVLLVQNQLRPSMVAAPPISSRQYQARVGPPRDTWMSVYLGDGREPLAEKLYRSVRVHCWVKTCPENIKSRAWTVRDTWGQRCNELLFVGEKKEPSLPSVDLGIPHGRKHLTMKTMRAFDYIYKNQFNDSDWFLSADDNTYVIVENLRYFLSHYNSSDPIYFGQKFLLGGRGPEYPSGGAGYVASKEALRRFGNRRKGQCASDGEIDDLDFGKCMIELGVKMLDTFDDQGKSRFHCFDPGTHNGAGYPDWYRLYDKYGFNLKGTGNMSDYTISYHYVDSGLMQVMDFLIYRLKPYGRFTPVHVDVQHAISRRLATSKTAAPTPQPSFSINNASKVDIKSSKRWLSTTIPPVKAPS